MNRTLRENAGALADDQRLPMLCGPSTDRGHKLGRHGPTTPNAMPMMEATLNPV
jgi:hypothetical protein